MDETEEFVELVENLCKRPQMYTLGGTMREVGAYLAGYAAGAPGCPLGGDGWGAFNAFVTATLQVPGKYAWAGAIELATRDDPEAIARLRDLLTDFARRAATQGHAAIVAEATARAAVGREAEEAGPVRAWRRFSRAIHRAQREEIEPLIQDHPRAACLWAAPCPPGVAELLDCIQESFTIGCVAGSVAEGEVTILTPDFGPVDVKLVDGSWRVDPSPVVAARSSRPEGADADGAA